MSARPFKGGFGLVTYAEYDYNEDYDEGVIDSDIFDNDAYYNYVNKEGYFLFSGYNESTDEDCYLSDGSDFDESLKGYANVEVMTDSREVSSNFLDKNGKLMFPVESGFNVIRPIGSLFLAARKNDADEKWTMLTIDGEQYLQDEFDAISEPDRLGNIHLYIGGRTAMSSLKSNMMRPDGTLLFNDYVKYLDEDTRDGWYRFKLSEYETMNLVNSEGEYFLGGDPSTWPNHLDFFSGDGVIGFEKNGKCNFMHEDGTLLSDNWFDGIGRFFNGFAVVEMNDMCYMINNKAEIVTDGYDKIDYGYYRGFVTLQFAKVQIGQLWYILDIKRNTLLSQIGAEFIGDFYPYDDGNGKTVTSAAYEYNHNSSGKIDTAGNIWDYYLTKIQVPASQQVQSEELDEAKATADDVYNKYYSNIDRNVFNAALNADPTARTGFIGKYTKWILNLAKKGLWKPTDTQETRDCLERFSKIGHKMEKNDIQQYQSVAELYDAIKAMDGVKTRSETRNDAEKVYEDSAWTVIVPHTKEAAQLYGSNTKWCTAGKTGNMFDYYNDMGDLYIIIAKKDGKKYQFHFPTDQYMDSEDSSIHDISDLTAHGDISGLSKFIRDCMEGPVNMSLFREDRKIENVESAIFGYDDEQDVEDMDTDELQMKMRDIGNLLYSEGVGLTQYCNKLLEFLPVTVVLNVDTKLDENLEVVTISFNEDFSDDMEYNVLSYDVDRNYFVISDEWFYRIPADGYSDGIILVETVKGYNYLTPGGDTLLYSDAGYAIPFSDGIGIYNNFAGMLCLIDKEMNNVTTKLKHCYANQFQNNHPYTLVTSADGYYCNLIDKSGNLKFDRWMPLSREQGNSNGWYCYNTAGDEFFMSAVDGSIMPADEGVEYLPQGVHDNINESILLEDNGIYDIYEDVWENESVSPAYILLAFKEGNSDTQDWKPLIKPVQYQNALRQYMQYGDAMRFPEDVIDDWIRIIVRNTCKLSSNTELAGHSSAFPGDDVEAVFGEEFEEWCSNNGMEPDYSYSSCSEFLDSIGFYDWLKLPDGSDAWSDYGLKPISDILSEYNSSMSAGEKLILVNRCMDVYHHRGDLASAFINGGIKSLTKATNNELFEQTHKSPSRGKNFIIHEEQVRRLQQLLENRESKNINLARKYLVDKRGYNKTAAQDILVAVRNDIPNSRALECKFLLGISRMYIDGELQTAEDIANLNNTLKYIAKAHANDYDSNLNGESAETLNKRFAVNISDDFEKDVERSNNREFTNEGVHYNIVKIPDFETASEYADYVSCRGPRA